MNFYELINDVSSILSCLLFLCSCKFDISKCHYAAFLSQLISFSLYVLLSQSYCMSFCFYICRIMYIILKYALNILQLHAIVHMYIYKLIHTYAYVCLSHV